MKYFKVVDHINSVVNIDTASTNYSLTLVDNDIYKEFLDFITQSSNDLDLPLDFYISLNNNIYLWGNDYIQNLPKSINRVFEIFNLTNKHHHKNIYIKEVDLIAIIETIDSIGFKHFKQGFYLWESIYEKVRQKKHKDKPGRKDAFFLFDNIEDCKYFIEKHKGGGMICEVEVLKMNTIFKGDMNLWDIITDNLTFKEAEKHIDKYWLGQTSDKPVFEYLFQGTCSLKPL